MGKDVQLEIDIFKAVAYSGLPSGKGSTIILWSENV